MYKTYEILEIDDSKLSYRIKYRFMVLRFCGADSKQVPIYNTVKKFRTYEKALEYVAECSRV